MDSQYVVLGSWAVGKPVDPEALSQVLAEFDRWHPVAVASLAETDEPNQGDA